ncbi:DNA-directed RNA polymerase [Stenotrophomonas sp. RG-453]|uniref:DNA-directed RNA polymerase n=1 Tax=Stenotrophomonas sp. RG-453 TaxID=2957502 RepID=UPI0029C9B72B|nr:DNA-directed RNA polymerase [Stenotrophomonas sp. RG-453]MDX5515072.1 T3/T7 RNA polymerase [Stenotrophomonas sp. RG-453]
MTTWQDNELHAAQLQLEKESTSLGIARYEKIKEQRQQAETGPGRKLVMESLDATAKAIAAFVAEADTGKPGKRHAALKFVRHLDPLALAYLTSFTCVNALVADHRKAVSVAITLGHEVANEINFTLLRQKHPGLYRVVQEQLKKSTSSRHSTAVMRHVVQEAKWEPDDEPRLTLADKDALLVGMKLIELFVEATGLIELVTVTERSKRHLLIAGNQAILDWLTKAHDSAALYQPVLMPMVVPPRPWTTPRDGGYLTDIGGRADLVRTRNRAYKRELALVDMPNVYQAVNAIQATPWKVNRGVLEVMRELWNAGGGVADLPERELATLPDRPAMLDTDPDYYKEHHADEFKEWKRGRAKVYEANARSVSTRLACAQKLALAEKFVDYPAIYFPHNLDFRGRVYPLPPTLTPQGDDAAKALLHFAEGVPLGEDGAFWLAVHLANCFGVDKVSFEERVQWVRDHEEQILDSALDPLDGQRFWIDADSPFCALAACFEWLGYTLNGRDHVSHIQVALDGSCNGLQNFSAMLRDSVGGAATNLVPQVKPADIYTRVRDVAQAKLEARAAEGDVIAIKLDGQLTRDIVKQPVMTLPYGVTKSGMRSQVLAKMKKLGMGDDWETAEYLAALLWECIGEVVIAARAAMDWLRDASKVASSADLPVCWTTPAGFPVLQEYREEEGVRINPHVGGRKVNLVVNIGGTKLDRRRQTLGISPNFVHSCDASHLMLTTCLAAENGITSFAMIHDSYGTHAGRSALMAAALRQAFVDQYNGDVLADFRQQLIDQLPPEAAEQLPVLPPSGDLDLSLVLDSAYFFA